MRKIIASGTLASLALLLLILLSACGDNTKNLSVAEVKIAAGGEQCALPGETFSHQLRVEILGREKGLNLRPDSKLLPVQGQEVLFTPVDGSRLTVEPQSAKTDICSLSPQVCAVQPDVPLTLVSQGGSLTLVSRGVPLPPFSQAFFLSAAACTQR